MAINTVPRIRQRPVSTVVEMIRHEKEQFFYELQAVIELAGGRIPLDELKRMTVEEIIDSLYTNQISFELRPILHMSPLAYNQETYLEMIHEAATNLQDARERATKAHAEYRRNE